MTPIPYNSLYVLWVTTLLVPKTLDKT